MLIDWFTVAAQVLNFLILVWLMKRFLYQPVLNAIAAREAKIAAELKDAADTKAKAHQQLDNTEFNFGYTHLFTNEPSISITSATNSTLKGRYDVRGDVLGASINYKF